MFEATARVVGLDPEAVVLLYIGTSDAQYGGTTWKAKFGLQSSDSIDTDATKKVGTFEGY
ncbi:MAG: hypothetical protein HY927_02590 [Elusimicrobia bacterium]|nr:hypothetical protein [Elusimicrobiota bacterium]